MSASWKITLAVACVLLICGASIVWLVNPKRAVERKLAQEAATWRARAEQGDAKAQSQLGSIYFYSKGVPRDYAEAVRWYQKAADQGYAPAEYSLSYMYSQGRGVPQSYAEAVSWSQKAADQGDTRAEEALAGAYYFGQGVPQDYSQAVRWYQKASDQGYARAQYYLGYMHYEGKGVPQSYSEAVHWFRKAADSGDPQAEDALGLAYASGQGAPQDDTQATAWYRRAAEQGFAKAQYDLGYMYHEGRGVPLDPAQAARWILKAARQGDERAQSVVSKPLPARTKGFLWLWSLAGTVLLIGAYRDGKLNPRQRIPAMAGLLVLLYVVSDFLGLSHMIVLQAHSAVNAFYFSKSLLGGISVTVLTLIFWPRGDRVAMKLSVLVFTAYNFYALLHPLWRFAWSERAFYSINGLLVGLSVASATTSWLRRNEDREKTNTVSL